MVKDKVFAYGIEAMDWLHFALNDMRQRTGWEFSDDMVEYLEDLVSDCGIDISSPCELGKFTDNAYVNWDWGHFGDGQHDGLETEQDYLEAYERGDISYYNAETKLYII